MRKILIIIAGLCMATTVLASPAPMSRDEIINMAKSGVSYSYYWGHGSWRTDGTQHGSCSGSCPDCTHSGSYGADCSGFVAKVWQVPSPSPVSTNSHPYSTYNFRYESQHWSQVSRSDAVRGDAMVYRNSGNTGGHVMIYESGDPWGQAWTYEARGCSYGIVHNLRSIGSTYVAIRRDNISEAAAKGTLIGSVYVDIGGSDMSQRIPGATVSTAGANVTARDGDAIWSFELQPGDYTITASAPGFDSNTRTCSVSAGAESWCSVGLRESCLPDCNGRNCGADGCGGSCGACAGTETCSAAGLCVCQPDCAGLQCGSDPVCGTSCGQCAGGMECVSGQCQEPVCQPNCAGRQCGPDPVCGTSCGQCPGDMECVSGQCREPACQPDCSGLQCGPDPVCGESCGQCPAGQTCEAGGVCSASGCQPDCSGRSCGPDTLCGLSCGVCQVDLLCDDSGGCGAIDPSQGKLFGIVREYSAEADEPGQVIPQASLKLDNDLQTAADENGYWELAVLPGEYTLEAEAPGFVSGKAVCSVEAGSYFECQLTLKPDGKERGMDGDEIVVMGGCQTAGGRSALILPLLLLMMLFISHTRRTCGPCDRCP